MFIGKFIKSLNPQGTIGHLIRIGFMIGVLDPSILIMCLEHTSIFCRYLKVE